MSFLRKQGFLLVISLLLSGLLAGCDNRHGSSARRPAATNVEVVTASIAPLRRLEKITSEIQPVRTVRIFNQEPGQVKQLVVYPGDRVKQGQLLVTLDDTLLQKRLKKARAQLNQAKVDLRRLRRLEKKKLASDELLARAITQVQLAQAEVEILQTRLSYARIHSPLNGIVTERKVEEGDITPLYSHIMTIADIEKVKIILPVSEILLNQIKPGLTAEIHIDAIANKIFTGKIIRIFPEIDTRSRKGKIEVQFTRNEENVLPGQLARVIIQSETTPRLTLPGYCIQNDNLGEFVYRVEKDKATKTRITTGLQFDDRVEIINGLEAGDMIISRGFQSLSDGSRVKVKKH